MADDEESSGERIRRALEGVKSIFVTSDEPDGSIAKPDAPASQGHQSAVAVSVEITNLFEERVFGAADPAYQQFKAMLAGLEDAIADPVKRYKATIKAMGVSGITRNAIQGALEKMAAQVVTEKRAFGNALQGEQVALSEQESVVGALDERITTLRAEIANLEKDRDAQRTEMQSKKTRLELRGREIDTAAAAINERIKAEIKKLADASAS